MIDTIQMTSSFFTEMRKFSEILIGNSFPKYIYILYIFYYIYIIYTYILYIYKYIYFLQVAVSLYCAEASSEPCQTSMMERFAFSRYLFLQISPS